MRSRSTFAFATKSSIARHRVIGFARQYIRLRARPVRINRFIDGIRVGWTFWVWSRWTLILWRRVFNHDIYLHCDSGFKTLAHSLCSTEPNPCEHGDRRCKAPEDLKTRRSGRPPVRGRPVVFSSTAIRPPCAPRLSRRPRRCEPRL
jgi:hypothetical protein